MKILMVYPEYPETFWSFKHILKFISKKAAFPPLGLLTVSSLLPKHWTKKLIDLNIRELKNKHIAWADMVFISAMIVQKESVKEIIARCKAQGKTVIAGGPLFTTGYKEFEGVDHFILNEGEVTLPMFLKDLEAGTPKDIYTSLERPDITKTPIPDWSLINLKKYATMCVQYSRGCPFDCEFCDIVIMNGRIPRTKSHNQFIDEFDALYKAGWRGGVFVVDDNFIGNKTEVKNMLPKLISWQKSHNYPFTLLTEASVNLADDPKLMQLMSKANFNKVFLGLETPDEAALKECNKFQNTANDIGMSVKRIHKHGMQVMAGFIVGFDSDNELTFDKQIKFIQQIGVVTAMVGMLNALPQTKLWNRLKDEGRLLSTSSGENTNTALNFMTKMDSAKLVEGYKKILSTIYSPKEYYDRITTLLKDYTPRVKERFNPKALYIFTCISWRIGVFSKSRKYYWKLMISTLKNNAKALPLAIELAIYGLHFEKVVRRIQMA